jgi:hypothetical protein
LNPSYWKYPGLSLSVIGKPYQRLAIITRGIVAYGPDNYRKCAIYAWNGDQYGSDGGAQWWGEMTLYSTSNNAVVILSANAGGSQSNSSYLKMYDATASTLNFFVDGAGNVTIRGTLSIGGAFSAGALSVTSLSVTNNITAGGSISGNSLNLGSGNATLGSISASGTVSANVLTANSHTGGTYSGSSLSVSGGISGSSATISGAVIGGSLAVTGRTVIDAGGNFIGNAVNAGSNSISGGPITGTQYSVGGTNVINTGGVFVGNGVNTGGNGIAGGGFNPYVGGRQYYGTNYDSFPLQDGRTVHVRGGIVVKIGDATPP